MLSFKGAHYPKSVILYAVFFYVRFAVSYRELEIIMAERGVHLDHATLNRWVVKYAPKIARRAQKRKRPTAGSWRMDETYVKVKGKWCYLYRGIDKHGETERLNDAHRTMSTRVHEARSKKMQSET